VTFVERLGFSIQKITKTILIPMSQADDLLNSRNTDFNQDIDMSGSVSDSGYYDLDSESGYDDDLNESIYDDDFGNMCIICFENERKCVIVKCGHLVLCPPCSKLFNECPYCRAPYNPSDVIQVYNV